MSLNSGHLLGFLKKSSERIKRQRAHQIWFGNALVSTSRTESSSGALCAKNLLVVPQHYRLKFSTYSVISVLSTLKRKINSDVHPYIVCVNRFLPLLFLFLYFDILELQIWFSACFQVSSARLLLCSFSQFHMYGHKEKERKENETINLESPYSLNQWSRSGSFINCIYSHMSEKFVSVSSTVSCFKCGRSTRWFNGLFSLSLN